MVFDSSAQWLQTCHKLLREVTNNLALTQDASENEFSEADRSVLDPPQFGPDF